ncbi:MAG: hypothetical protein Q8L45_06460 [Xanthomonadaceae bacterium]|nr:hypothetical protein [Xanthomonadaceae bacterium]MDP2186379.1 hypothetical protein [Xanthomonadales bacterium]MDZ4114709.1 hypothetical protein [Xanthomonadaceae bacterium]MDZ4377237.1 hypothetical protein [Xanthomonadaceae bacterium]
MADCQAISETLLLMGFGRFATGFAARTTPSLRSVATLYPSCEVCGIPQTTIASIENGHGNLGVERAKAVFVNEVVRLIMQPTAQFRSRLVTVDLD